MHVDGLHFPKDTRELSAMIASNEPQCLDAALPTSFAQLPKGLG
jgi:hypothetical protein